MRDLTLCVNYDCPIRYNCARKQDTLSGTTWAYYDYGNHESLIDCEYFIDKDTSTTKPESPKNKPTESKPE